MLCVCIPCFSKIRNLKKNIENSLFWLIFFLFSVYFHIIKKHINRKKTKKTKQQNDVQNDKTNKPRKCQIELIEPTTNVSEAFTFTITESKELKYKHNLLCVSVFCEKINFWDTHGMFVVSNNDSIALIDNGNSMYMYLSFFIYFV